MEKKFFGRFNIIDIILFSIIIVGIIIAVVRIFGNGSGGYEDAEITAVFVTDDFRSEVLPYLQSGEELMNEANNSVIGRVVSSEVSPEGVLSVKSYAEGAKLEHGIMLGNTTYFIGSEVSIIAGDAVFDAYLSDIELIIK